MGFVAPKLPKLTVIRPDPACEYCWRSLKDSADAQTCAGCGAPVPRDSRETESYGTVPIRY